MSKTAGPSARTAPRPTTTSTSAIARHTHQSGASQSSCPRVSIVNTAITAPCSRKMGIGCFCQRPSGWLRQSRSLCKLPQECHGRHGLGTAAQSGMRKRRRAKRRGIDSCPNYDDHGHLYFTSAKDGNSGSRARCVGACTGPLTAQGPTVSGNGDTPDVAFRLPPRRRHPEVATARAVGHIFRGSIPGPHVPTARRVTASGELR
jgi:hypothetical protein